MVLRKHTAGNSPHEPQVCCRENDGGELWLEHQPVAAETCRMSRPDRTEAKAEFFKLLAEGQSVAAAARQVGIHHTVGYYWVKCRRAPETAEI